MTTLLTSFVSEKEATACLERFFKAAECTTQAELAVFFMRQAVVYL